MSENSKPIRCIAHPGCQFPHCYCQPDPPQLKNQFREKVDLVARELQRVSIALTQFKEDLKDVELENTILLTGIQDLISKYTEDGKATTNTTLQLLYCNVIKDLESVINVSQQTSTEIFLKTQKSQQ